MLPSRADMHRWPKDHPLWPVVYMLIGSGCVIVIMFATATNRADGSEVIASSRGLLLTGAVGWIVKKIFSA